MNSNSQRRLHFWSLGVVLFLLALLMVLGGGTIRELVPLAPAQIDESAQELVGEMEGIVEPVGQLEQLQLNWFLGPSYCAPPENQPYEEFDHGPGMLLGTVPVYPADAPLSR
jgi:hypothetical protein